MRGRALVIVAVVAGVLTGCGSSPPAPPRVLTVAAAASLSNVYARLKEPFEASHPGVTVRFDLANSALLAQQVVGGAPVDVYAAASPATMDIVARAGRVDGSPVVYASNHLMIATAPDNPRRIGRFADLATPGTRLVIAPPQTPCGAATAEVARRTGVTLRPVSEQDDVVSVVSSVQRGNADAGVVFVTEVRAAGGQVTGIAVPEAADVPVLYPVAALTRAPSPDLAHDWVGLVTGPQGRAILTDAGFGPP